jgi:DNA-binding SARP family transcriptional activator/pimeloyl-ACP methyl ester carboxylesterase
MVEFGLLGSVEVWLEGRPIHVGGPKRRALLAALLCQANRVVSTDWLIEAVWGETPPGSATAQLHAMVSELRRSLAGGDGPDAIVTRAPGYLIRVEPEALDVDRFHRRVREARRALAGDDAPRAAAEFRSALELWRGEPLSDVEGSVARAEAAHLAELRLVVLEERVAADLASGRDAELVPELTSLVESNPFRERLRGLLMVALYRSGRQADALSVYQQGHRTLAEELGLAPGPDLRELEQRILRHDPSLLREPPREAAVPHTPAARAVATAPSLPATRYVKSGDIHIAYGVIGHGEPDIVFVPGAFSHLDLWWEVQATARFFQRLGALGRLIMFDKRDTGLSDRAPDDQPLEQRMDDVRAVMNACESERAVLFGYSEGGPMSILFAATHPERVTGLILGGATARWSPAPDYPCGHESDAVWQALERLAQRRWGEGGTLDWFAPSQSGSARARQALARWERLSAGPSAVLRLLRMMREIDVRAALPSVRAPALVIQRLGDLVSPRCHGRYLASHLPNARYVEQPGDHLLWMGDTDALLAEIDDFLSRAEHRPAADRMLATILFAELLDPTVHASPPEGEDGAGGSATRAIVERHRGRLITSSAHHALACFDGPVRAINCAIALRTHSAHLRRTFRGGLHAGEIANVNDDITGAAVQIARQVTAAAGPGEILVTHTVKDLVIGSGIQFTERDTHPLADDDNKWATFAITET